MGLHQIKIFLQSENINKVKRQSTKQETAFAHHTSEEIKSKRIHITQQQKPINEQKIQIKRHTDGQKTQGKNTHDHSLGKYKTGTQ